MRDVRYFLRPLLVAGLAVVAASPLHAQYIGTAPPPPLPSAPPPGTIESPAAALSRAVRVLAASPRDFAGLMAAGRAELALGDLQSAAGFFGRADEVRPSDPAPKVGMGATTVLSGDARGALDWFAQAQRLGASPALLGADRGLAHDLLGELDAAQADYRAALLGPTPAEARRRLALSLAIAGRMNDGLVVLQPLVSQGDVASRRVRAFVLALGGQQTLASQAIGQAMPGSAARIGPFFALLPRLSVQQKAAAVHLGVFPNPGEMQLAAAEPSRLAAPAVASRNDRRRERPAKPVGNAAPPLVAQADPPGPASQPLVAAPSPTIVLPSGASPTTLTAAAPPPNAAARPGTDPSQLPVQPDRLSGIDRLLKTVQADPPRPTIAAVAQTAQPRPDPAAERKAANKKLADDKARKDKAAADKKARDDKAAAASLGVAGTHWIQLAGGADPDRMVAEYKRLRAKSGGLLIARAGYVTGGKDYFRLLVGPFASADDARVLVNKLDKAGVDSFSWTRSPPQIKIEKLPAQ